MRPAMVLPEQVPRGSLSPMSRLRITLAALAFTWCVLPGPQCHAGELVTLRNGFSLACDHHEAMGATMRLYLDAGTGSYVDVNTAEIAREEAAPPASSSPTPSVAAQKSQPTSAAPSPETLTGAELHQVLAGAGQAHDLDVDLLASVVHAESNGRVHAVSRAGAEGLMQLMPATAAGLGVHDAFAAEENVGGGVAYLDALLHRYHDNLALALAAYNAGPGAVDRWHGIPPYRETRAYVARIIHDFNQRYAARQRAARTASVLALAAR